MVQTGAYHKVAVPGADRALFIGLMTRMRLTEEERVAAVVGD